MTFLGIIWTRKTILDDVTINHESIHLKQERELLFIGFCVWYLFEYFFVRSIQYRFKMHLAYRNVSFEREAYENEHDLTYLKTRRWYSFLKYL